MQNLGASMKFYIILLRYGKVIEINSYDTPESRDSYAKTFQENMCEWSEYDDIQILDQI